MRTIYLAACVSVLALTAARAAVEVRLTSSVPSPQPVGTVVGLMPRVKLPAPPNMPPPGQPPPDGAGPGRMPPPPKLTYRYSVSVRNGPFRVIRDFSQQPNFAWAPELYEHQARIRVTVRNGATKETTDADLPFQIVSRIHGTDSLVTPTSNPLVALFSSPACPQETNIRIAFRRKGEEAASRTTTEECRGNLSNNVYVAGMRADSDYEMRAEWTKGSDVRPGAWLSFHTGLLDGNFPPVISNHLQRSDRPEPEGIVIRSLLDPWRPEATDLEGNVVWYLNTPTFITRVLPGGRFLANAEGSNSENAITRLQLLRELDLVGNTLRETNISIVAEQLESRGIKSNCKTGSTECVPGFHHDAIRLPNGHTLALAGLERIMPAGTQGSKEPVDVLGDLILDLDENFQVAWAWNSFDHLDIARASLGDEKCQLGPGNDGCTPVFLGKQANGWLHSNSLDYMPQTGDLVMSMPEQDWVVKIDYKNGTGTGKVLWRLGKDGDFTTKSDDPYPWFSYQHDVGFDPATGLLIVFDDGHRRKDKFPAANNRGQAWKIDEDLRTATLVMNADVGVYAVAVGSAQPLSNGNYSFESGFLNPGPAGLATMSSQTTETSPDGKIVYTQQLQGGLTYRSFRVPDMYSAPRK